MEGHMTAEMHAQEAPGVARPGTRPARKTKAEPIPLGVRAEAFADGAVEDYRGVARKVVSANFVGILNALAEKAVNGSLLHMKLLFELGGVKEDIERRVQQNDEPTLLDLIVAEIRRGRSEGNPTDAQLESAADSEDESGLNCGAKAQ